MRPGQIGPHHDAGGRCLLSYLPLATGEGDVDEAASVQEPLPRAALGDLLLLLGLNLGGLRLDLAGTGEGCSNNVSMKSFAIDRS